MNPNLEQLGRAVYFIRIGMTAWGSVSLAALERLCPDFDYARIKAAFDAGDFVYAADLLETEIQPLLQPVAGLLPAERCINQGDRRE